MHDLPPEYLAMLKEVHQELPVHSLDDLSALLKGHQDFFAAALQNSALKPYHELLQQTINGATGTRDNIYQAYAKSREIWRQGRNLPPILFQFSLERYIFRLALIGPGLDAALNIFNQNLSRLEEQAVTFQSMHNSIAGHIQMEVLPNDALDGERTLLAQGYFVFPTIIKSEGFFVFKYSQNTCPHCKDTRAIKFQLISEYGSPSLEQAMAQHVPSNMLGSVIIASNTERYPLSETVMPILAEKYSQKVKEDHYN